MSNLDDLYNQIQGQSPKESPNKEEQEKLDQVETTQAEPNVEQAEPNNGQETPIDSTGPGENTGNNVVEPDGEQSTSKREDEPEGEGKDDLEFDLDDFDFETDGEGTTQVTPEYITKLAKELGDDSIKGDEDVVNTVKSLRSKLEELESSSKKQFENVPEELAKAINVAKAGGDYKSVLGLTSVDYSKIDPVELYENEVIEAMKDDSGNVDMEQVDEYLDSLSYVDKQLKGKELRSKYLERQRAQLAEIEQEARVKQEKADKALNEAVNSKTEIAGFKLKPQHKQMLVDGIKSGKMMNEMFLGKDGEYDFNKISDTYFKIKFFDKIQKVYESKIKNSTKREMIDSVTNSDIDRPQRFTNADQDNRSRLDMFVDQLKNK